MGLQTRPGINIQENLISSVTGTTPFVPTVAFLAAERGPSNVNTVVTDQVDFIQKFGYPSEYNYKSWYNIYEYLRYTNYINVMRVIDTDWKNFGFDFGRYHTGEEPGSWIYINLKTKKETNSLYNSDIAFNTILNYTFADPHHFCSVHNRDVTLCEDIAINFCMSSDEYDEAITTEDDVIVFQKIVTALPTYLTSDMEVNQLFILNTAGVNTVYKLTNLTDEPLVEVSTILDTGVPKTKIKILRNSAMWSDGIVGGTLLYDKLYFRNTKRKDLNDTYISIDSSTNDATYTYLTLDENLSLTDITGKVVFYDKTIDFAITTEDAGYLVSEQKTFEITTGNITYDETQYKCMLNSNVDDSLIHCTRIIYDSKLQNNTTIKTFRQIINKDIDFTKNFVFLVFKKLNGLFSLMEAYEVAQTRDATVNAMYKRNYCEDVINQNSKYVYFVKNPSTTSDPLVTNNYSILELVLSNNGTLTDYTDLDDYTTFDNATKLYRNNSIISFKYLLGIELNNETINTLNLCPIIADERKDCIAVISVWDEDDYLDGYDDMSSVVLGQLGLKNYPVYLSATNTYTAVYDNMKMIYSEFLEKFIWIPVIGDIAGIYVTEDTVNSPYSAAAGFKTTPIQNNLKMLYTNVSNDNMDLLCYHSINHIIKNETDNNFYLYDILMYNEEELLTKRLNIRRTLNHFKYNLRNLLKNYIFEKNNFFIRNEIINNIDFMLSDMLNYGAIAYGDVLCDESNNTPDTINAEELHIQISLQPTHVIRQIFIEINIEKQNLTLSEIEL